MSAAPPKTHHQSRARFMLLAVLASFRSKDRSACVGAVFADSDETRVLSAGYNGFPKTRGGPFGDPEIAFRMFKPAWLEASDPTALAILDKNQYVIHAEVNALLNMASSPPPGLTVFVTLIPCPDCIRRLGAAGVGTVVFLYERGKYVYDEAIHGTAAARYGMDLQRLADEPRSLLLAHLGRTEDELRTAMFGSKDAPVGQSLSWVRTIASFAHAWAIGSRLPAAVLVNSNYAIVSMGRAEEHGGPSAIEAAVFANPTGAGIAVFVTHIPVASDILLLAQYGVENIFFSTSIPVNSQVPNQRGVLPPDVHFQPTWELFHAAQIQQHHAQHPQGEEEEEGDGDGVVDIDALRLEQMKIMKMVDVFGLKLQFVYWDGLGPGPSAPTRIINMEAEQVVAEEVEAEQVEAEEVEADMEEVEVDVDRDRIRAVFSWREASA